jgi:hypothetical protein
MSSSARNAGEIKTEKGEREQHEGPFDPDSRGRCQPRRFDRRWLGFSEDRLMKDADSPQVSGNMSHGVP